MGTTNQIFKIILQQIPNILIIIKVFTQACQVSDLGRVVCRHRSLAIAHVA